jgi:hypothetical protein
MEHPETKKPPREQNNRMVVETNWQSSGKPTPAFQRLMVLLAVGKTVSTALAKENAEEA